MLAPRKRARGSTTQTAHVPAPIGGINTVDGGSVMPPADCIYLWNMLAAEYGLRSRLGYREWCTSLTGAADEEVRSTFSFTGNAVGSNRTFATTSTGIWDVTNSSTSPTQVAAFGNQGLEAGYGVSTVCTTPAGRFCLYTDEENGLFIYSEATDAWAQVTLPPVVPSYSAWQADSTYAVGWYATNAGNLYVVTVEGESATEGGPTGTGSDIVDNTVHWAYVSAIPTVPVNTIYPSVDDQALGYTGDPSTFVFVTVFKNRVWFVERNSSRGWYLDVNAIYGEATSFDFGSKMRAGGVLRGLWNWSYDGGNGLDTLLVGVSGQGDIVIYAGTDPESADTFGIKGVWSVGSVPAGRRIATENGGDLLVLSTLGVVQMSKLVLGNVDPEATYSTYKIGNLFNQLAATRATLPGWSIFVHPTDNALMITIPVTAAESPTEQLVMAFGSKGWSRYRGLPILSAGVSDQELYFGTADGRVCRNIEYLDNVTLADPNSGTAIAWSLLTAYRNLGNMRQKQVKLVRPILLGGATAPALQATAKYDYDLIEPAAPSAGSATAGWDVDEWDEGIWDADYRAAAPVQGAVGMGRDVALAVRGQANGRAILVGIDVDFEQGGVL